MKLLTKLLCNIKHRTLRTLFAVFQVLLAFGKDDVQSDAFCLACEKLGYECSLARSREAVLETFQTKSHEIVIIDNRNPKVIDGESICR
jgi:DNA-binding response OmpR family regulator